MLISFAVIVYQTLYYHYFLCLISFLQSLIILFSFLLPISHISRILYNFSLVLATLSSPPPLPFSGIILVPTSFLCQYYPLCSSALLFIGRPEPSPCHSCWIQLPQSHLSSVLFSTLLLQHILQQSPKKGTRVLFPLLTTVVSVLLIFYISKTFFGGTGV
jgi:hypothetical protein